jgi:hypothetical protein
MLTIFYSLRLFFIINDWHYLLKSVVTKRIRYPRSRRRKRYILSIEKV